MSRISGVWFVNVPGRQIMYRTLVGALRGFAAFNS